MADQELSGRIKSKRTLMYALCRRTHKRIGDIVRSIANEVKYSCFSKTSNKVRWDKNNSQWSQKYGICNGGLCAPANQYVWYNNHDHLVRQRKYAQFFSEFFNIDFGNYTA